MTQSKGIWRRICWRNWVWRKYFILDKLIMKLLKTITHPDFPTPNIEIDTREAARIVLVDSDGNFPIIYTTRYDIYCIPGGGIDEWESIIDAVKREAREETGCEIEILWEIGKVIEKRSAEWYARWLNLIQTSYCYYGKVISKWEVDFTQKEIGRWFKLKWLSGDKVLENMENTSPSVLKAQLVAERDMYIFKQWYKKLHV